MPKKVAILATTWWNTGSADWLAGKMADGYDQAGGPGPDLALASVYLQEEKPERREIAELLCGKWGVPIASLIPEALTLGTGKLAVDAIMLCANAGYPGQFPPNADGQRTFPHAAFWNDVRSVFEASNTVCPVFSPNLIETRWDNAKAIYDYTVANQVPFMSGSAYPTVERGLDLEIPLDAPLTRAVAIGSSHRGNRQDFEHFARHTLEAIQCQMERRAGGETGVASVRCLSGKDMWTLFDGENSPRALLEGMFAVLPRTKAGDYRELMKEHAQAGVVLISYIDGTKAMFVQADGYDEGHDRRDVVFGGIAGGSPIRVTFFISEGDRYLDTYNGQMKAIDMMCASGVPPIPVERTLLCNGILDAAMRSRAGGNVRIQTPHLAISYKASTYPFGSKV